MDAQTTAKKQGVRLWLWKHGTWMLRPFILEGLTDILCPWLKLLHCWSQQWRLDLQDSIEMMFSWKFHSCQVCPKAWWVQRRILLLRQCCLSLIDTNCPPQQMPRAEADLHTNENVVPFLFILQSNGHSCLQVWRWHSMGRQNDRTSPRGFEWTAQEIPSSSRLFQVISVRMKDLLLLRTYVFGKDVKLKPSFRKSEVFAEVIYGMKSSATTQWAAVNTSLQCTLDERWKELITLDSSWFAKPWRLCLEATGRTVLALLCPKRALCDFRVIHSRVPISTQV